MAGSFSIIDTARPMDMRAHFYTHRKESEADLKESLESAKVQQKALRTSSSYNSNLTVPDRANTVSPLSMVSSSRGHLRKSLPEDSRLYKSQPTQSQPIRCFSFESIYANEESFASSPRQSRPLAQNNAACYEHEPSRRCHPSFTKLQGEQYSVEYAPLTAKEARRAQKEQAKLAKVQRKAFARQSDSSYKMHELSHNSPGGLDKMKKHGLRYRLMRLTKSGRKIRPDPVIPKVEEFDSKEDLKEYLNTTDADQPLIAELPADLPPYTRFESPHASNVVGAEVVFERPASVVRNTAAEPITVPSSRPDGSPKTMSCDSCEQAIGKDHTYYHCVVCDGGDRIVCAQCLHTGKSCRHRLEEKVMSVYRSPQSATGRDYLLEAAGRGPVSPSHPLPNIDALIDWDRIAVDERRAEAQKLEEIRNAKKKARELEKHREQAKIKEILKNMEDAARHREQEVARRERAVITRESETILRETEAALREREADLRSREASLREQQISFREREALYLERIHESRRFTDNSRGFPEDYTVDHNSTSSADLRTALLLAARQAAGQAVDRFFADSRNANFREHGGQKRKADTADLPRLSLSTPGKSQSNGQRKSVDNNDRGSGGEDDGDGDEGLSKRTKAEPDSLRLLACPYSKFDMTRFSERNTREMQYRGCSSCYITDISRLKQHLYRVHRRPQHHCARCFSIFDSKDDLDRHSRQNNRCSIATCSFEEKFSEDQLQAIKKRRPGKSLRECWYIIYEVLFPGAPLPESPYTEDTTLDAFSSVTTDPMNAAPSSPTSASQLFNELLSSELSRSHEPSVQRFLSSPEIMRIFSRAAEQSMTEVFRRISPTITPTSRSASPNSLFPPSLSRSPVAGRATYSTEPSSVSTSAVEGTAEAFPFQTHTSMVPEKERKERKQPNPEYELVEPDQFKLHQYLELPFNESLNPVILDHSFFSPSEALTFGGSKGDIEFDISPDDHIGPTTIPSSDLIRPVNFKTHGSLRTPDSGYGTMPQDHANWPVPTNSPVGGGASMGGFHVADNSAALYSQMFPEWGLENPWTSC